LVGRFWKGLARVCAKVWGPCQKVWND
jgi:hypothetical protein